MASSQTRAAELASADQTWSRSARLGWILSEGFPLGPFEGIQLTTLRSSGKTGKLHGSEACTRLRRATTRCDQVSITAEVLNTLCPNCTWTLPAAHPIWDLAELASSTSIALSYGSEDDHELANQVSEAAAILRTHRADDDDDDRYRKWSEALELREAIRRQWRQLTTYTLQAHQLVASAPWIADWAAKPLADLEAQAETYRRHLAQLIDPLACAEAARLSEAKFPGPSECDEITATGLDAGVIERMWDRWADAAVCSWTRPSESSWHATHVLTEALGRRRNGRQEAIAAAERIVATWCEQAEELNGAEPQVDLWVRVPPLELRPSWQVQVPDTVDRWLVAAVATYQQGIDWKTGTVQLRCPTAVANLLAQKLYFRLRKDEPIASGAVIGEELPRPILWGPAQPLPQSKIDVNVIEVWPAADSPTPHRASALYGRWSAAHHGDVRLARALATVAETTDLRSITWPDWMTPHDQHQAYAVLLMEPGMIGLRQFVEGAELGPLANVQVYATDALGRYQGKSHGIGCVHNEELRPDDEIYTLAEFINLLRDSKRIDRWFSRWCSKCGGYSIRRLNNEQLRYFETLQN